MKNFYDELKWRGLVYQQTDEKLGEIIANERPGLYIGFDPTATSLHVGSMLPLTALVRAQRAGLKPIALVGGATGMVGDPSGKSEERKLLDAETLERNLAGLRAQLEKYLDFTGSYAATLVNNYDWFRDLGYLEFLRSVGKLFSVNAMIAKESVRARLEDREQGISYTEFSYMLIQAYDFLWLYEKLGCRLQVGGSDQWGNITAGIELVRRKHGVEVYGLTMPLVMSSTGQKFGKSEKGAVWIDPERTSPYELYQFFMHVEDRDVGRFLRYFTFLDEAAITALDETVARAPEKREAQRVLAREVTTFLHGREECAKAEQASAALFGGGDLTALDARTLEALFRDAPTTEISAGGAFDLPLIDALQQCGLVSSKGAARREIEGGGVYVNQKQVTDVARRLGAGDLLAGACVVLRRGKKTYHLLRVR
jgi:tyrosyl-tRNA synthetase